MNLEVSNIEKRICMNDYKKYKYILRSIVNINKKVVFLDVESKEVFFKGQRDVY